MRLLRIGVIGCSLGIWAASCGDDDEGRATRDAGVDAGSIRRDAAVGFDAGQAMAMPDRCLTPSQLEPAQGPRLPVPPRGGAACLDVGEPFSARCDGGWCLDAPRTPFDAPAAIGGSSTRDVWLLAEGGALAHLGCSGWTLLPDPLEDFPRCTTPSRFDWCTRRRNDDEDEQPSVGSCGATCRFAARAPDDVWLSNSEGPLHHFDGTRWSRVQAPDGLVGADVWATSDRQIWLTSSAQQAGRAYRREADTWVSQSAGVFAELDAPVVALAADAPDHAWAASSASNELLHFDGTDWSWVDTGPNEASSLLVLARDAIWLGGSPVRRWNGSALESFTAQGALAAGTSGEVWAFPRMGLPQRWTGKRFQAEPHPRADYDFVQAGFGARAWVADRAGGVSMFEDGSWRFVLGGDVASHLSLNTLHGSESEVIFAIAEQGEIVRRDPAGWRLLHSLELAPRSGPAGPGDCCQPTTAQGIFVRAADDVWFFGERDHTRSVLAHFDGQCFREHNLEDHHVAALYSAAPDAAWAVGAAIFAWDGERWREQKVLSHLRDGYYASTVWGTSADDVWVGGAEAANQDPGAGVPDPTRGWLARWDGAAWSFLELPDGTSSVQRIAGRSATDVWILTWFHLLHWDGSAFSDLTPTDDNGLPLDVASGDLLVAPNSDNAVLCTRDGQWTWSGTAWQPDPDLRYCPTSASSLDEAWTINVGQALHFTR